MISMEEAYQNFVAASDIMMQALNDHYPHGTIGYDNKGRRCIVQEAHTNVELWVAYDPPTSSKSVGSVYFKDFTKETI